MSKPARKQRGMALIFMAISMFVVVMAAAFGVDLAYVYVQKNRLQNAADAAAIAGANTIYRSIEFRYSQFPTGIYPNPATSAYFPNIDGTATWTSMARGRVKESLTENQSRSYLRSDADIYVDWYNVITGNPNDLKVPAVRVNLFAPTSLFFAKVVGLNLLTVKAQATAVATFPKTASSGLPFAMASCAHSAGWDFARSEPIYSGSPPKAQVVQFGTDSPSIVIPGCANNAASGSWTNFNTGRIDANTASAFIPTASAPLATSLPLTPNAMYTVSNGRMNTLFSLIDDCRTTPAAYNCQHSVVPVLESGGMSHNTEYKVQGFSCIKVLNTVDTGSAAYVVGEFSTGCRAPSTGAGGNNFYGVISSPTIVE